MFFGDAVTVRSPLYSTEVTGVETSYVNGISKEHNFIDYVYRFTSLSRSVSVICLTLYRSLPIYILVIYPMYPTQID